MIEQHIDDPYPDGAVIVETEGDITRIYFADDVEAIEFVAGSLLAVKTEAKRLISNQCCDEILKGVDSNAAGLVKNYRTSRDDQANIMSAVSSNSGSTVTQDGIKVILNVGQTIVLNFDIAARREALFAEKESRNAEIDSKDNQEAVDDIVNRMW